MLTDQPLPDLAHGAARCVGRGGQFPDADGPAHAYMRGSPGCWQLYGELSARAYDNRIVPLLHTHSVDCYAVQHPGGSKRDRRQRQSVAVHLISLCLLLEFDQPPSAAAHGEPPRCHLRSRSRSTQESAGMIAPLA